MRLRVFQRYVVSILQCVYRTCVIPFTIHIGRNCCKSKKKYFCFKLAIPIIYTYISIRVPVDNPNNRDQDYLYPSKDYYNENYYKLKHKESQRYGEPIKLNRKRKFILLWNSPNDKSFYQIEEGNRIFRKNRCPYNNCFITRNKHVLSDIRYFDAIVFGLETTKIRQKKLPKKRSPYQKYIFYSTEPPQMNPACDERFHNFFNWTWTYKLDSDIRWGLVVRDSNGAVVGPKQNMKWISANPSSVRTNSESENKDQEILLSSKYLAAAWIASNEWSFNSRDKLIAQLKVSLSDFDLKLDFIGSHGRQCKENNENITCDDVLEKFYYFYLAFEKAMSVDYVTPILLHAFQHNTVPIVYGGGDYTSFLPPGSYLDANLLSPDRLAEEMSPLILDDQKYLKYFEWKKHYSFHETNNRTDTNEYCQLCALLNEEPFETISRYENFRIWWNSSECKSEVAFSNELS